MKDCLQSLYVSREIINSTIPQQNKSTNQRSIIPQLSNSSIHQFILWQHSAITRNIVDTSSIVLYRSGGRPLIQIHIV